MKKFILGYAQRKNSTTLMQNKCCTMATKYLEMQLRFLKSWSSAQAYEVINETLNF